LNLVHDDKWQKNSNTPLKQAVTELLDHSTAVQIDNGNADNHGEKRYLQKVLLNGCGALKPLRSIGTVSEFAAESDPSKIDQKFPALKKLVTRLAGLKPSESLVLSEFIREMRSAPVGAGGTMLVLAVAHAVRAFGERLRVFSDSTHTEAGDLGSYEAIINAVAGGTSKLELSVREITAAQRSFIDFAAKATGAEPLAQGETRTVTDAFDAVRRWWKELPSVAKVMDLHPVEDRMRLESLKQLLDDSSVETFEFMLNRLPSVYAGEPIDSITASDAKTWAEAFASDVKRLNAGLAHAQREVATAVLMIYDKTGDMVECEKAVKEWFESLTSDQRDPMRCEDHDDAQVLLNVLSQAGKNFDTKLTSTLPVKWGLGDLSSWTSLQTTAFKAKWEQAKKAIDEIKPLVQDPTVDLGDFVTQIKGGVWEIEDGAKVSIGIPQGAKSVIYTIGTETPGNELPKFTLHEPSEVYLNLNDEPSGKLQV
jgi:hypothetical protein